MALLTTFANAVGSIPLSQLDSNFANVNGNADFAITAGNVTGNIQANITQLGNLTNLTVTGNTTSNILIASAVLSNTSIVLGNISSGNLLVNNVASIDTLIVTDSLAVTDGFTANTVSTNALTVLGSTSTGNLTQNGVSFISINTVTNSLATANITLSSSTSYNLIVNNVAGNIFIVPPLGAVEGQVINFTIGGNSTTNLIPFSGTWVPTFGGSAAPGTAYQYVNSGNIWYKLA